MNTTIENERLRISARQLCAELTSIFDKANGTEHLWQAHQDVWGWYAPNLFPVVGGCVDNQILIEDQLYPMDRHGFLRKSSFALISNTGSEMTFSLSSSETTLKSYPYQFEFQVIYGIVQNTLQITYKTINRDHKPLYFSVGAHPAFNVPFYKDEALEDYYLEFEKEENTRRHLLDSGGYFTGATEPILTSTDRLPLSAHLFDKDAIVIKSLESRKVAIKSNNHTRQLIVNFPDFEYLGIWAKSGAKFVCIEPWLGCADTAHRRTSISEKEGIIKLDCNKSHKASFTISLA